MFNFIRGLFKKQEHVDYDEVVCISSKDIKTMTDLFVLVKESGLKIEATRGRLHNTIESTPQLYHTLESLIERYKERNKEM